MLRSLSPCLAFHSNPPIAFHMHNIPPWAPHSSDSLSHIRLGLALFIYLFI